MKPTKFFFAGICLLEITFFPPWGGQRGASQDLHFSQTKETPLLVNPALTGVFSGDMRAIINYKDQWSSFGAPYKTYLLQYDIGMFKEKMKNSYLGAGLFVYKDKAGDNDLSVMQASLSLSGVVILNMNNMISGGLQGGFAQRSINASNMKWGNQFDGMQFNQSLDPKEKYNFESYSYGDYSAGIAWNYGRGTTTLSSFNRFISNAGVAFYHVNKPKQKFLNEVDKLYSKAVIHGNIYYGLMNTQIALLPSVLVTKQGPSVETNLGLLARFMLKEESKYTKYVKETAVLLGGSYRVGDAIIPMVMIEYMNFAMGISYDVNVSGLTVASNGIGGLELSLRFINPNPFRSGKSGTVPML